jgi:catechol 2,3-dioxygenase-like lactoylglutathione lyase family enzyme
MIKNIAYTHVWVKDQNEALRFYTEILGFEIRADQTFGDFRWLTVGVKGQPDLELGLSPLKAGNLMNEEQTAMMAQLQAQGKLGGILFQADDVQKTYEELSAKGVAFIQPPTSQPYGIIEAILKDPDGNWFSLYQPL